MKTLIALLLAALPLKPPSIEYVLRVDAADLSSFAVEMRLHSMPDTFTLAAAAHPEYDDKYWRYLEGMSATHGTVTRLDSVLWKFTRTSSGDVVISYRIRPPQTAPPRAPWRAYLTATGGVVGGPHSFLYVVGQEQASARVRLELPRGWQAVSGMDSLRAPNMHVLMDSPIMIGDIAARSFEIQGVPHDVAYLRMPGGAEFDTTAFVRSIERFARATVDFWGSMPYRRYVFMFADSAWFGGLEHINSFTLGAPSGDLARNPLATMREIGHEFFHTWNLMRIKPIEYRDIDYRVQPPVASLWFSEGVTIFYADRLMRQAGVLAEPRSRITHVESVIARYLSSPGEQRISAEQGSRVAYNAAPSALGDYRASTHLQGEAIANVLDLLIRSATDGTRSLDDAMRGMLARFSTRGFTGEDVERVVSEVCSCDARPVFEAHVRSGNPIDFDSYFNKIGMRVRVSWEAAVGRDGQPLADNRVAAWEQGDSLKLRIWIPDGQWGRAGFHTGDRVVSLNGQPLSNWPEFRTAVGALRIGDTARLVVMRPGGEYAQTITVTGFDSPVVRIEELPDATERQRRLRAGWLQ